MLHQRPRRTFLPLLALSVFILPVATGLASVPAGHAVNYYGLRYVPEDAYLLKPGAATYMADGLAAQPGIGFANAAFQRVWERTDKLVASGEVKRSWYWGPVPGSALQEDYAEGPGGKRVVQYFDKSRMEINNPNADPNSPFFVTNGLLTVELISGKMQVGNSAYVDRNPASIPLASDADDPNAPTYASFLGVSNTPRGDRPAVSQVGQPAILTISRTGAVGEDATKSSYPGVNIAHFEPSTSHNIPQAMWDFLNESGPVYNSANGQTTSARLSEPWFYATGYPISEPYWARVKIAGQMQDVLIQAFERRVVTYTPNGVPGFKVQMGNIGAHYYDWRYRNAGGPPVVPTATPRPILPTVAPIATVTAVPTANPNADCSNIPAPRSMVVRPNCGPPGTTFNFEGSGFQPGESVAYWVTLPDQSVYGTQEQGIANANGQLGVYLSLSRDPRVPAGIWATTMRGITSQREAIGYFKVTSLATTPTPTPGGPPPACDTSGSRNGEARPNSGKPGDTLVFVARGFQPGEEVSYWFTFPDGDVVGTEEPLGGFTNPDGSIGPIPFQIPEVFGDYPGTYGLTFQGRTSGNTAVIFFCVSP